MRHALILAVLALAACGADGAPERPGPKERQGPGVSVAVTGSAEMGVAKR